MAALAHAQAAAASPPAAVAASPSADLEQARLSLDWLPVLVNSSAILAECLADGITQTSASIMQQLFSSPLARGFLGQALAEPRLLQERRCCTVSVASALLHSDALSALSRLFSVEAQRGSARALLSPRQLAACLKPISGLLYAAEKMPSELLDVCVEGTRRDGQQQQQQHPSSTVGLYQRPAGSPAASTSRPPTVPLRSTAASAPCNTVTPAGSAVPRGLAGSGISPAKRAAKSHSPAPPGTGSATVPSPQQCGPTSRRASSAPPQPPRLASAVLTAVAESGVLEAACKAAMQLLGGGQQGEGAHWGPGDREHLVTEVLELLRRLVQLVQNAGRQAVIPLELLASTFTGPCVHVSEWRVADESAVNELLRGAHTTPQASLFLILYCTNVYLILFEVP